MRPLKVVHILNRLAVAGAEYNVIKLVNRLDRARFAPVICALRIARPDAAALVAADVPVWECHRTEGLDAFLILRLARRLRAEHVDVVHTHNWSTSLYGVLAARLAGVKVIVHGEHGLEVDNLVELPRRVWIRRLLAAGVDRFVGVSAEIVDRIERQWGVSRGRITYIPNGVDLSRFGAPRTDSNLRAALSVAPSDPVIACIGVFRPVKDLGTLVRAFAIVHRHHPSAHLLLIGPDTENRFQHRMEREAPELGPALARVRYLGLRLDTPELLSIIDVYANSSLYEGMSNTILEAMASRKPVVATAVGGTPSLVTDGEEGLLVPPQRADLLADRILRLLADPAAARRMGQRGRERVERAHSFARMIALNAALYESLHARKASPLRAADRAKIAVARVSLALGVTALAERSSAGSLVTLTYHRILPCSLKRNATSQPMIASEEAFDLQMAALARDYRVLSQDDVREHFRSGRPFPRGAVHVTFDDGYADNFEFALPILVRHGIRATLFLTTGPLDTGARLWWDDLAEALLLLHARRSPAVEGALRLCPEEMRPAVRKVSEGLGSPLHEIDRCIAALNRVDGGSRRAIVAAMAAAAAPYRTGLPPRLMLTWDEVRAMQRQGVSLGGHTVNHSYLDELEDAEGLREVSECLARIEQETGVRPRTFSYPSGRTSERSRAWFAECGVEVAMTTVLGRTRPDEDRYSVKRWDGGYLAVHDRFVDAQMRLELSGAMSVVPARRAYR